MMTQTHSSFRLTVAASLALTLSGCALFSKNDPLVPRYFTPEMSVAPQGGASGTQSLRVGRVLGSDHLRERIAYRTEEGELGYHEGLRWTERPEEYVRRAVGNALFEERGMTRVISGGAPTLEIELIAFEELRRADDKRAAKVTALVFVHDGRVTRLERTVSVEEPLGEDASIHALVRALSRALHTCVTQVASDVEAALAASPAARPAVDQEASAVAEPQVGLTLP